MSLHLIATDDRWNLVCHTADVVVDFDVTVDVYDRMRQLLDKERIQLPRIVPFHESMSSNTTYLINLEPKPRNLKEIS